MSASYDVECVSERQSGQAESIHSAFSSCFGVGVLPFIILPTKEDSAAVKLFVHGSGLLLHHRPQLLAQFAIVVEASGCGGLAEGLGVADGPQHGDGEFVAVVEDVSSSQEGLERPVLLTLPMRPPTWNPKLSKASCSGGRRSEALLGGLPKRS